MKNRIGIRRENKDKTEKRTPLTPEQVKKLVNTYKLEIQVEYSPNRIFAVEEYQQAGATVVETLQDCNIVFGVKEIPTSDLAPGQAYCFFSHTIKGQSFNMPMLKRMLDLRDTLIDYERVVDKEGKRIIFFGRFAGYAGMIDTFWALGRRLNWEGIRNPFSSIKQALQYHSLNEAKDAIREMGKQIEQLGFGKLPSPVIFGFTGYGQVSKGAQEIFDLLSFQQILPGDLEQFIKSGKYSDRYIYKVVFREKDMFAPKDPHSRFILKEYYSQPEKYRGVFEQYIPFLTAITNGIYWESQYPRLVTQKWLEEYFTQEKLPRLKMIADISCDVDGSIECNTKATNSANPVYVYDPITHQSIDGVEGRGPVILAVDKLPAELPREASRTFGNFLLPFVPQLAKADFDAMLENLDIPVEFIPAIIAHKGRLTSAYQYLSRHVR
jgi:saccharopine dehydrogenase (NAD+, L-lysine-forming)